MCKLYPRPFCDSPITAHVTPSQSPPSSLPIRPSQAPSPPSISPLDAGCTRRGCIVALLVIGTLHLHRPRLQRHLRTSQHRDHSDTQMCKSTPKHRYCSCTHTIHPSYFSWVVFGSTHVWEGENENWYVELGDC